MVKLKLGRLQCVCRLQVVPIIRSVPTRGVERVSIRNVRLRGDEEGCKVCEKAMECATEEDKTGSGHRFQKVSKPKVSNRNKKREVKKLTERTRGAESRTSSRAKVQVFMYFGPCTHACAGTHTHAKQSSVLLDYKRREQKRNLASLFVTAGTLTNLPMWQESKSSCWQSRTKLASLINSDNMR